MNKSFLMLGAALLFGGCTAQRTADCPNVMCTQDFRYVTVQLISGKGGDPDMKNYDVLVKSSGKKLNSNPGPDAAANPNTIIIADDSNLKTLNSKGEALVLSISRNDGSVLNTPFVVSGGVCNCHVSKISGPDQIDTDKK